MEKFVDNEARVVDVTLFLRPGGPGSIYTVYTLQVVILVVTNQIYRAIGSLHARR